MTYEIENQFERLSSWKSTRLLFEKYEKELLPFLFDKEEYLKNNDTHLFFKDEVCKMKFNMNREAHLKLLNSKLAEGTCNTCHYLGFECSCEFNKRIFGYMSNMPTKPNNES